MTHLKTPLLQRLPRLSGWSLISVLLLVAVFAFAPHQLPVSLYKLSLVSLAAVVGYYLDRSLFPYARPDAFMNIEGIEVGGLEEEGPDGAEYELIAPDMGAQIVMGVCMLRRAIIVGCAMLAMGLGA